ncbi:MAG: type II secretion system protein GspG [Verrucomicrobiaceae bacterium]
MNTAPVPLAQPLPKKAGGRVVLLASLLLLLLASTGYFAVPQGADVGVLQRAHPEIASLFQTQARLNTLESALVSYSIQASEFPTTEQGLKALIEKPANYPAGKKYSRIMKMVFRDSWDQEFRYRSPASRSGRTYDLYSIGPDGIDGTDDDIGNREGHR